MKKTAVAHNPDPLLIGIIIILSIWQLFWKGVSLWRASQQGQRNWFMALFILIPFNDLAILEIVYLFWFAKKRITIKEIKTWIKRK